MMQASRIFRRVCAEIVAARRIPIDPTRVLLSRPRLPPGRTAVVGPHAFASFHPLRSVISAVMYATKDGDAVFRTGNLQYVRTRAHGVECMVRLNQEFTFLGGVVQFNEPTPERQEFFGRFIFPALATAVAAAPRPVH